MPLNKLHDYVNEKLINNSNVLSVVNVKNVFVEILWELYEINNVESKTKFHTGLVQRNLQKIKKRLT